MAFNTADGQKSFGSAYKTKKYDSFHPKSDGGSELLDKFPSYTAGPQPGETNENSHAESQRPDGASSEADVNASSPEDVVAQHGPAISTHYVHDHDNGKHSVSSTHSQGHQNTTDHDSADQAYEYGSKLSLSPGGEDAWRDTKRRLHPSQQGADSSERQYEAVGSDGA